MSKTEAGKHYKEYLEAVKTRKEKHLKDLKQVYFALKKGNKILDIYDAFKNTGVDEEQRPKLAIARADLKIIKFRKEDGGAGYFSDETGWQTKVTDVILPGETFPNWEIEVVNSNYRRIKDRDMETTVPVIPAHLLPKGQLKNYHILWEVEEWKKISKVKDPFLLKRINSNTFVILAAWDLTEVEQIVMRGV